MFGHMGFGLGGWVMWLFWVVLIALAVILLVRLLAPARGGAAGRSPDSPVDILKRRYARGEIRREEYERKLADLTR